MFFTFADDLEVEGDGPQVPRPLMQAGVERPRRGVAGRRRQAAGASEGLFADSISQIGCPPDVDRIYVVLGGFHLRDGDIISATVAALAAFDPVVAAPAHCTSWKARPSPAAVCPGSCRPNAVDSRFEL